MSRRKRLSPGKPEVGSEEMRKGSERSGIFKPKERCAVVGVHVESAVIRDMR